MISISLLLVGFLGTITLINRSVGLTRVVADSYVGTYLASEGIEVVKSMVDSNYLAERAFNDGFAGCAGRDGCEWEVEYDTTWEDPPVVWSERPFWFDPASGAYSYVPFGAQTSFTRKVTVRLLGESGRELQVESRVQWRARGGGLSATTLEDRFFDWYLPTETATTTTSTVSTSTPPSDTDS